MPEITEDRVRRWLLEAEGYMELGLTDQAREQLERADETPHMVFEREAMWGEYHRLRHEHAQAIERLLKARALQPNSVPVAVGLGWSYKRSGRLDMAIESLRKCLEANPKEGILHYNLSCYYSIAGERDEMLKYFRSAVALLPKFRDLAAEESDFDRFRQDSEFRKVIEEKGE